MKFELHITVETADIDMFKYVCGVLEVKPIIIETEKEGVFAKQVMTSSKYEMDTYVDILDLLTGTLRFADLKILRQKVEIKPESTKHPDFIYYESHLRLKLSKDFDKGIIKQLCSDFWFHMSRNLFKSDENFDYQMITYRDKLIDYEDFVRVIGDMYDRLGRLGIQCDKVEIEECIFDSNESVDKNWL